VFKRSLNKHFLTTKIFCMPSQIYGHSQQRTVASSASVGVISSEDVPTSEELSMQLFLNQVYEGTGSQEPTNQFQYNSSVVTVSQDATSNNTPRGAQTIGSLNFGGVNEVTLAAQYIDVKNGPAFYFYQSLVFKFDDNSNLAFLRAGIKPLKNAIISRGNRGEINEAFLITISPLMIIVNITPSSFSNLIGIQSWSDAVSAFKISITARDDSGNDFKGDLMIQLQGLPQ
jgi:hypothetical protein